MEKISLEYIKANTKWVARLYGGRFVGTYEEVKGYRNDEDCKEVDVVCADGQPEDLKPFWKAYEKYGNEHGFITMQKFYNEVWKEVA